MSQSMIKDNKMNGILFTTWLLKITWSTPSCLAPYLVPFFLAPPSEYGKIPDNSSYNTIPKAYTSLCELNASSVLILIISGAIHRIEPST